MKRLTTILGKLAYGFNVLAAMGLLITCILSFVTSNVVSPFSILSLFVPILFLLNLFFLIFWMFRRKKKFILSLAALLIGYLTFGNFFMLGESANGLDRSLKVMSYNVLGFNKYGWIKEPNVGERIVDFVKLEDPEVLCVQEHSRIRHRQLKNFPYRSETPYTSHKSIQAIFSKYPIVNSGSLDLPKTTNNIIYADILYHTDTLRIYNFHLQSFSIVPSANTFSDEQTEKNFKQLVRTFRKQLEQVELFNEHRSKSPYPTIICGDLNNTQFSNIYRLLKGDFSDTFLEKGSGFGRTYNLLGYPMRIDYIFTDPAFEIVSHKNFDEKLSDHYPIMATLQLKKNQ